MTVSGKLPYEPQVIKTINTAYVITVAVLWFKDNLALQFRNQP